ncbi:LIM domain only protein 3 [Fasciolopsis buskii]|uniref:LIM domain only protein 3 n=1 Tax=Fasciolopsis buskii TaxID=27845 RepID=A0A8E0RZ21_9TREM|nr:LIM domain only protein 3 [Fasciolopsis buski]
MKEGRNTSMHNPTSTTTGIGVTNTTTNSCIPNSSNSPCCWSSCNHLVANSQIIHLPVRCFKCKQVIREAHLLLADEQYWHEDCLRCVCCEVRLAELDKHFYVKADMPLCRRDYLRLYGQTGECFVCRKRILAFEFVMRIQNKVYHLNCFSCQQCQLRFCVGDKFYLHNQFILCEQDYAYMVLASIQPTILLPVAARNPLVSGRFSQSRLVRPPIVSDRPYLCRTHTMKEPIPSATASLSQSKSDQLISICELENNQRTAQLFPGLVKSPIKIETTIRDTEDGSLLPQMFDGSSQSWSISSLHIPNFTGQSGLCDDHSSGYGSPSPTLSTQMDLR